MNITLPSNSSDIVKKFTFVPETFFNCNIWKFGLTRNEMNYNLIFDMFVISIKFALMTSFWGNIENSGSNPLKSKKLFLWMYFIKYFNPL